jgi:hypothetical protein
MKIFDYARRWWRKTRRRGRVDRLIELESLSELPRPLGKSLYIIGSPPKWAILACPCGCGDRIDVNLMKSRSPRWKLTYTNNQASLDPSLWMPQEKCGSHFWLRSNRIIWTRDWYG